MNQDLTSKETDRQDFVDNFIMDTIVVLLNPDDVHARMKWDIEKISKIRNLIWELFGDESPITEQEFYPFIGDGDD